MLPPGDVEDVEEEFGLEDDEAAADEPPPKRSKTHDSDDEHHHQELWDLGLTWPSLERLELGSFMAQEPSSTPQPKHGARTLALLPRSLTWLNLPQSNLKPLLALVPPELQTIFAISLYLLKI